MGKGSSAVLAEILAPHSSQGCNLDRPTLQPHCFFYRLNGQYASPFIATKPSPEVYEVKGPPSAEQWQRLQDPFPTLLNEDSLWIGRAFSASSKRNKRCTANF